MNFLMMIGSQRAGSTILHSVIKQCTNIKLHPVKELHYFDTKYNIRDKKVLIEIAKRRLTRQENRLKENPMLINNNMFKIAFQANNLLSGSLENIQYLDLFMEMNDAETIGECTPEYMLLPSYVLNEIKDTIPRNIKVILIARNPVKRFLSAVKLLSNQTNSIVDKNNSDTFVNKVLKENYMSEWLKKQDGFNAYSEALKVYKSVFRDVLMIRYDDFIDDRVNLKIKLEDFLDLKIDMIEFEKALSIKKNVQGENLIFSDTTIELIQKRYQDSQTFIDTYFNKSCIL